MRGGISGFSGCRGQRGPPSPAANWSGSWADHCRASLGTRFRRTTPERRAPFCEAMALEGIS